ncbi:hypothetical protein ACM6L3_18565 [Paenibacillus larvae]
MEPSFLHNYTDSTINFGKLMKANYILSDVREHESICNNYERFIVAGK